MLNLTRVSYSTKLRTPCYVLYLELRGGAGDVDAAGLVGEVAAVVLRVTLERGGDAAPRLAHELRRAARALCGGRGGQWGEWWR